MKRLIVCCDGTWNTPGQEDNGIPAATNVYKLFNAIETNPCNTDVQQMSYYHTGVGGEPGWLKKVFGGAIGAGISRHICEAYHWLANNYEEGDKVYLFGFSRGAFCARSLGGFLGKGLLDLRSVGYKESWKRVKEAYDRGYRIQGSTLDSWAKPEWEFFHDGNAAPIRFIGVWDTVGALGIPDDLELFNFLDRPEKWKFHDTQLGKNVETARHAMSIDERRSCFTVTRWHGYNDHRDAKEVWFPGVHSDVGGGYCDTDLSDGALLWMMEEVESAELVFRQGAKSLLKPDPLGVMHNSYKGAFSKLRSRPRNIDALTPENHHLFHDSAIKRQKTPPLSYPPYLPTTVLKANESITIEVFADKRWTETGVYLDAAHSYVFHAQGEWLDSKDACDWKGTENDDYTFGDLIRAASDFWEKPEKMFKKLTKNESTDFLLTKRVADKPWFAMIGAITNDEGSKKKVKNDGSPVPHQCVNLSDYETKPLAPKESGYLYCFPNDVWTFYKNNHGSIRLTVKRVS